MFVDVKGAMRNKKLCLVPLIFALCLCCPCMSGAENAQLALLPTDPTNEQAPQPDSIDTTIIESDESEKSPETEDVFYPTKDWQTIKPGQAIPKGLHVRMNLATGLNEAKLLEKDSNEMKYWNKDGRQGMINTKRKAFSRDELKQALKNFKTEMVTDKESMEHVEKVKRKFRSYTSLKEDLKLMNAGVKTDNEIVTELVVALKNGGLNDDERASILRNLEYYVHQIDNAVLFGDLGGMTIIHQSLNSSNAELKKEASSVLGAAVQSNAKAQIKAMEHGLLTTLLRRLSIDVSKDLQKVYLFALSSLVRHFPYAQSKFLQLGGLSVLSAVFTAGDSGVLRLKTVTLLHDLMLEKEYAMISNDTATDQSRKHQYSSVPLVESLVELGWCERIPVLLTPSAHDTNEKVLRAMLDLTKHCGRKFATFIPTLYQLRTEYTELVQEELSDDPSEVYFSSLLRDIDDILRRVIVKDEL